MLFGSEQYDSIYDKSRYLITVKCGIAHIASHDYAKIKVNSHDSLPLEKQWLLKTL